MITQSNSLSEEEVPMSFISNSLQFPRNSQDFIGIPKNFLGIADTYSVEGGAGSFARSRDDLFRSKVLRVRGLKSRGVLSALADS